MPRANPRRTTSAIAVALAAPLVTCSLLVDTTGLTGGPPSGAPPDAATSDATTTDSSPGDDAGRAPLFAEDWEHGASRWNPEPGLVHEDCSTTFQRETILYDGGRVSLVAPLSVGAGEALCLVAWVRGSASTQPFLGVGVDAHHHWLIGRDGYKNDYGGTAVAVAADGRWHWYAAPFVVEDGGAALDILDELFKDGAPGTADFDDIRVYAGDCPTVPTGAPHVCP
jgi:hypothetical protein